MVSLKTLAIQMTVNIENKSKLSLQKEKDLESIVTT